MHSNSQYSPGLALLIHDLQAAVHWLTENLFFTVLSDSPKDCITLQNGTCKLYLFHGNPSSFPAPEKGNYITGIVHIALQTYDVNKAIEWCKEKGLSLQLNNDQSFFNPKVFGQGERYFNIISPFGITFEVSERVGWKIASGIPVICGLDHIGIPTVNIQDEIDFFLTLGFIPEFSTVTNYNEIEGTIYCSMLKKHDVTLEIYQFADLIPKPLPTNTPIQGLIFMGPPICSPGGARLI
ncbi:VOC family protein [Acetanaerobacterium elongatum]|uniref:VOC domain-containing protein n=1 Tax=Acetanaerobacterium elongatum TaxID=258515 RepID=A0A1G9USL7_9FIRM|nr:VOC family protein [Acetanaerobacterium elongatum]SDM62911.1 hypothetical protein SAMN05192585_102112 [Acetanaerobacterium elongatum]